MQRLGDGDPLIQVMFASLSNHREESYYLQLLMLFYPLMANPAKCCVQLNISSAIFADCIIQDSCTAIDIHMEHVTSDFKQSASAKILDMLKEIAINF